MYLIVGLGNVGDKYKQTPHNAGFLLVDRVFATLQAHNGDVSQWKLEGRLDAEVASFKSEANSSGNDGKRVVDKVQNVSELLNLVNGRVYLLKPTTLMNLSGQAVIKAVKWFDINVSTELIVVYDDLDISLGKFKVTRDKSPHGHNGISSVINGLGTSDFWHVRLGIDNRAQQKYKIDGEKYVLGKYSDHEWEILKGQVDEVISSLFSL